MRIKRFFRYVLPAFLVAIIMLSAYQLSAETTEVTKVKNESIIPNNAAFVANVDLGAILQKSNYANLKNLELIKAFREELKADKPSVESLLGKMLVDPSSCGINTNANMIGFVTQKDEDAIAVLSFLMKNRNDFEVFASTMSQIMESDKKFKSKYDSNHKVYYANLDDALAVYNDERLLIVCSIKGIYDSSFLKNYATNLLKLNTEECIAQDKRFKEYWANRGDISVFATYKNLPKKLKQKIEDIKLPKGFNDEFADMAAYMTLTCEKGVFEVRINTIGMPERIKKLTDHSFNKSLLKYMPENTLTATTLSINPANLIDFIKYFNGTIDSKDRDIINAFGGSFVANCYDITIAARPCVAFAADITNREVIKAALEALNFEKDGDFYYFNSLFEIYFYLADDALIAATNKSVVRKAANREYSNGLKKISAKAKDGNYFYLDLNIDDYPQDLVEFITKQAFTRTEYYTDPVTQQNKQRVYYAEDEDYAVFEVMSWFDAYDVKLDGNGLAVKLHTSDNSINSLEFILKKTNDFIMHFYNKL